MKQRDKINLRMCFIVACTIEGFKKKMVKKKKLKSSWFSRQRLAGFLSLFSQLHQPCNQSYNCEHLSIGGCCKTSVHTGNRSQWARLSCGKWSSGSSWVWVALVHLRFAQTLSLWVDRFHQASSFLSICNPPLMSCLPWAPGSFSPIYYTTILLVFSGLIELLLKHLLHVKLLLLLLVSALKNTDCFVHAVTLIVQS